MMIDNYCLSYGRTLGSQQGADEPSEVGRLLGDQDASRAQLLDVWTQRIAAIPQHDEGLAALVHHPEHVVDALLVPAPCAHREGDA